MKNTHCLAFVCATATATFSSLLPAALLVSDSFETAGVLNGRTVESASEGSYIWHAAGPYGGYYNDGGMVKSGAAGTDPTGPVSRMAWINYTLGADEHATCTVDVRLVDNLTGVSWTSLSFLEAPWATYDSAEWNTGQLTIRMMNTGEWWVLGLHYGFNSQDILAHGLTAPSFHQGGWNTLTLDFNQSTNTATAAINGVQVMAPVNPYDVTGVYPDSPTYEPAITSVGFQMYGGSTWDSAIDNFHLSVVPEPRVGLLASLLMAMTSLFRRRA